MPWKRYRVYDYGRSMSQRQMAGWYGAAVFVAATVLVWIALNAVFALFPYIEHGATMLISHSAVADEKPVTESVSAQIQILCLFIAMFCGLFLAVIFSLKRGAPSSFPRSSLK